MLSTRMVKFEVPAVDGVPLISPPADSVSPPGNVPDRRDQAYGALPPVAANVWE